MGRAPRTKETLPDFHEWCRVTRHSRVFRGLIGCQRTTGFYGITAWYQSLGIQIPWELGGCKGAWVNENLGLEGLGLRPWSKGVRTSYVCDYLGNHGTGLEHYMHCVLCDCVIVVIDV